MKNILFTSLISIIFYFTASYRVSAQEWVFERKLDAVVNGDSNCTFFDNSLYPNFEYYAPTFYDWNKDGLMDIFIGLSTGKIAYWQNNSSHSTLCYELVTNNFGDITLPYMWAAPSFGNLNGDSIPDLVCGTGIQGGEGGFVTEYYGKGSIADPKFEIVRDSIASVDVWDASVPYLVDFDSNGTLDLFIAGGLGMVVYIKNTGTPTASKWGVPDTIMESGSFREAPIVADVDCDGKFELLISDAYGKITKYENISTNIDTAIWVFSVDDFATLDACLLSSGCRIRPAVTDIDNNGTLDWLIANNGLFHLYRNTETDPCNPNLKLEQLSFPQLAAGRINSFFDINGDSLKECFMDWDVYGTKCIKNEGSPSKPNWVFSKGDFFGNSKRYRSPQFFDADNDNDLDAVAIYQDRIVLMRNQSSSWEQESDSVLDSIFPNYLNTAAQVLIGNIDNDKRTDLFVYPNDNGKLFHFIDTDTTDGLSWEFQTDSFLPGLSNGVIYPSLIDLDRDGKLDFVFNYVDKLYWYRNANSGFELKIIEKTGDGGYFTLIDDVIADTIDNCGPEFFLNNRLYLLKGVQPHIQPLKSNTYLEIDTTIQLSSLPFDSLLGVWSGDGINSLGQFNPKISGQGPHLITYTYTDPYYGCTHLADTVTLFVQTVSTDDPTNKPFALNVFPNPSNGCFSISWSSQPVDFYASVFNAQGLLIQKQKGNGNSFTINVFGVSSGIYCILVQTEKFNVWEKVKIE